MVFFNCKAVLFDLDGVLVDSTPCVERHWKEWADKHGYDAKEILKMAHGRRTVETLKLISPDLDAEFEAAKLSAAGVSDLNGVTVMNGARELLASLQAGRWAIVTSGPRGVAQARLTHCGLPVPDVLVTAENMRRGKPDPDGYLAAAERLHCPPEDCIVVEDAPPGIEAALSAGMWVIAVATTHAPEQLQAADAVINTISELTAQHCGDDIQLTIPQH